MLARVARKSGRKSPQFLTKFHALAGLLFVVGFAAAGCAYRGDFDDPIQRRLQWFSFLDGGDIRAACGSGSLDRYRLVYNARFAEQVRAYEVTADGAGGAYLTARARGPYANLILFRVDDPLAPFRWPRSDARLSPAEFAAFKSALAADGFLGTPPVGDRFSSEQFYWVASGCMDGVHHFGAWRHPSVRLAAMATPAFLFAHDATGVRVNMPHGIGGGDYAGPPGRTGEAGMDAPFWITIDADGIGGTPR
jgi:hypothetical protein